MEDDSSFIEEKDTSEWGSRTISILGVAKSFISQLSVGQDLTKVSLPSVFLYPFSMLELGSARFLPYFDLLLKASQETDPFERFLGVVKYYLTLTQKERFDKKPYNPILGETHTCCAESQYGTTAYYSEQVSHHPPVSGCYIRNNQQNVAATINVTFEIKFHGNSVSIATNGGGRVDFLNSNEYFTFSKALPDMVLKNVIIGTKRIVWDGPIVIECPTHGYKAILEYKEEGWYCVNTIYGSFFDDKNSIIPKVKLTGSCSDVLNIATCVPDESTYEGYRVQTPATPFLKVSQLPRCKLKYYPRSEWDELNSLNIWKDVSQAIVVDDMASADNCKRMIEEAQRKRKRDGTSLQPRGFKPDEQQFWWPVTTDTDKLNAIFMRVASSIISDVNTPTAPPQPTVQDENIRKETDSDVETLIDQTQQLSVSEPIPTPPQSEQQ